MQSMNRLKNPRRKIFSLKCFLTFSQETALQKRNKKKGKSFYTKSTNLSTPNRTPNQNITHHSPHLKVWVNHGHSPQCFSSKCALSRVKTLWFPKRISTMKTWCSLWLCRKENKCQKCLIRSTIFFPSADFTKSTLHFTPHSLLSKWPSHRSQNN